MRDLSAIGPSWAEAKGKELQNRPNAHRSAAFAVGLTVLVIFVMGMGATRAPIVGYLLPLGLACGYWYLGAIKRGLQVAVGAYLIPLSAGGLAGWAVALTEEPNTHNIFYRIWDASPYAFGFVGLPVGLVVASCYFLWTLWDVVGTGKQMPLTSGEPKKWLGGRRITKSLIAVMVGTNAALMSTCVAMEHITRGESGSLRLRPSETLQVHRKALSPDRKHLGFYATVAGGGAAGYVHAVICVTENAFGGRLVPENQRIAWVASTGPATGLEDVSLSWQGPLTLRVDFQQGTGGASFVPRPASERYQAIKVKYNPRTRIKSAVSP